jgi:(2Fe-2S) ferredoxin
MPSTSFLILCVCTFWALAVITPTTALSSIPSRNKGTEVRICHDRDCLTDGAVEAKKLVEKLAKSGRSKSPVTITTCGCLGPCGKGPSVDVRIDGVRVKDNRIGQSNYYCFREINSAEAAADMLQRAGVDVPDKALALEKASRSAEPIASTRKFLDFDRTTRIALQRLLYVTVALPIADADHNGTWDQISGVVYPNSYAAIIAIVFIGSQFMGTGSKANSMSMGGTSTQEE